MENISHVAELLHQHGAYLDVRDIVGHTPLHESCRSGALDIVQWLLERGADVNAQCCRLYTPVHVSADYGCLQVLKLLIASQGQYRSPTVHGKRPLHVQQVLTSDEITSKLCSYCWTRCKS